MKCFYHSDIDGKSAASVVARFTGNYNKDDYIMYNYTSRLPIDVVADNETVYIVDLSFSTNTVEVLTVLVTQKNCDVIWCDHHDSSMELIKQNEDFCNGIKGIRQTGISGAALTYMYLYNKSFSEVPLFLQHISDFDCWLFKKENTLEFKYAIESRDHDALDIIWNKLMRDENVPTRPLLQQMFSEGKIISKYVKRELEDYRDSYAYESEIDRYKCLVVNRSANSLVFGDAIKKYPIVATWVYCNNGKGRKYKYSIYTENPNIDCAKIAEGYGGGGHRKAAGFSTNIPILS